MDELTIFLLIIGLIIIAVIAVVSLLKNKKNTNHFNDFSYHDEDKDILLNQDDGIIGKVKVTKLYEAGDLPSGFSTKDDVDIINIDNKESSSNKLTFANEKLPEGMSDLIISMAIQRENHRFSGNEILNACQTNGMIFGEMDIFHYPANEKDNYILFSLANMMEPGTFNLDEIHSMSTPGLSVFIQLPLPMNCVDAYKKFVEQSQKIAKVLHAELYDDKFNLLTQQIISHNIETINAYRLELIKAQKKSGKK
ncbi:MAG: cell division protein ZipA [Gammaproteobacteria bacterium]|nr:cell division protein ZipA [Gammaproteobacteria bacterium]